MKKRYAGERDRRIEVVKFTTTKDSVGEPVETQSSLGNFWAYMQDLTGVEDQEGKVIHMVTRTYTIPFSSSILAFGEKMEVIDGAENYNVFHVQEVGRREQLYIKCTRRE